MVRVYAADGKTLLREMDEEQFWPHRHNFDLKRNKRGYLKKAVLKGRNLPLINLSRAGLAFEQELPAGRVWALRGVAGSC